MADTVILARRSALAGSLQPGDHGANRFDGPGIHLTERAPFSVVQVEARADAIPALAEALEAATGTAPSLTPNQSAGTGRPRILGTGAGQYCGHRSQPCTHGASVVRTGCPDAFGERLFHRYASVGVPDRYKPDDRAVPCGMPDRLPQCGARVRYLCAPFLCRTPVRKSARRCA